MSNVNGKKPAEKHGTFSLVPATLTTPDPDPDNQGGCSQRLLLPAWVVVFSWLLVLGSAVHDQVQTPTTVRVRALRTNPPQHAAVKSRWGQRAQGGTPWW